MMESTKFAAFLAVGLSTLAITVCVIMVPLMYQQLSDLQEDLGIQFNEESQFAHEINRELATMEDAIQNQQSEQEQQARYFDFSIANMFLKKKRQAPGCSKFSVSRFFADCTFCKLHFCNYYFLQIALLDHHKTHVHQVPKDLQETLVKMEHLVKLDILYAYTAYC